MEYGHNGATQNINELNLEQLFMEYILNFFQYRLV